MLKETHPCSPHLVCSPVDISWALIKRFRDMWIYQSLSPAKSSSLPLLLYVLYHRILIEPVVFFQVKSVVLHTLNRARFTVAAESFLKTGMMIILFILFFFFSHYTIFSFSLIYFWEKWDYLLLLKMVIGWWFGSIKGNDGKKRAILLGVRNRSGWCKKPNRMGKTKINSIKYGPNWSDRCI